MTPQYCWNFGLFIIVPPLLFVAFVHMLQEDLSPTIAIPGIMMLMYVKHLLQVDQ